uniref:Uncharacterized protein n=1 Tax=Arundo donax TaxID=35708 RepID=A0A0A9GVZ7_ARUDO
MEQVSSVKQKQDPAVAGLEFQQLSKTPFTGSLVHCPNK